MPERERLRNYASLIVKAGLNLQPGQKLFIGGGTYMLSPEIRDFVRLLTEEAYAAGAGYVYTYYEDEEQVRALLRSAKATPQDFPVWHGKWMEDIARGGGAFLTIACPDPDSMDGIDPERLSIWSKARNAAFDGYRAYTRTGKANWCIAAAATEAWARKLYPALSADKGKEALWREIFSICRATGADAANEWRKHELALKQRQDWLNARRYRTLIYRSATADLSIDLPERHLWSAGGMRTPEGLPFSPNIPTEEAFTSPLKTGVNGRVSCTLPLVLDGSLVDGFTLTFKEGRIVDVQAKKGLAALKSLIESDEGAHYLGEVALVPVDSPLAELNRLFYNTLYDENASCHLAIGSAYPFCLENGATMPPQEVEANGLNRSLSHVDFMIGSADLDIDGILADGTREPVFRAGRWAQPL